MSKRKSKDPSSALLVRFDKWIERTVRRFLSLINAEQDPKRTDSIVQFVKFGLIGLTNTVISYLLNAGTLLLLEKYNWEWDYIAANMVAFTLSVLWSFYWNNKYVFVRKENEERVIWKALLKTYISYGITGIVLTNILSFVWISILGISKYLAPIINLVISVPLNFILNKKWSFN